MQNVLVTGGAGFIGSNFVRYLLKVEPGVRIINLDALTYAGSQENLKDLPTPERHTFIQGNICDQNLFHEMLRQHQIDTIVHFAAESHVDRSILGPGQFVETNILGTFRLLEAARKYWLDEKILPATTVRFHHISTDEVFGSLKKGEPAWKEEIPYAPNSPYAASKAASDHLVRSYGHTYGLPFSLTNCSNNYGPYMDPEKFFSRMITNLIDDKPVPIYGDGKYVRDWLYVEDHCRAIDAVLTKGKVGETYLVGGLTEDINNLEVAKKLLQIFGKDESYLKYVKDRPGHDRRYAVDWGKIKSQLGWKPLYGFDEWLVRTVEWYRKNEQWWRPLKRQAEALYTKTGQK